MKEDVKKRVFEVLEFSPREDVPGKIADIFIITLILFNAAAVMLETVAPLAEKYGRLFRAIEFFSVGIFTAEYILRMWSCVSEKRFKGAVKGRLKFAATPLAVIDLLAILPFYLPLFLPFDLRVLRVLRLYRLFVLFKIARYSNSIRIFLRVIQKKKSDLAVAVSVTFLLIIIAATFIYYAENAAQPGVFSSIPAALYWAVETLTTVGYGDVVPVTPAGKLIASVISILGIGIFAMPAGILAAGFSEEQQDMKKAAGRKRRK